MTMNASGLGGATGEGVVSGLVGEPLIRIPCPFCDRAHVGEFEDDVEKQIMACRDLASPQKRGDLAAWDGASIFIVGCEAAVPSGLTGVQDSALGGG